MMTAQQAQDSCARIVDLATRAGADTADAVASASSSESVSVRLGALEDVERSEGEEIGLRVFVGQRSATISTSDFSDTAFAELVERVVAMAKLAPEDPYAGLAPQEMLTGQIEHTLDLVDPDEPDPAELKARALEVEDAGRAVAGITNSNGGSAGFAHSVAALVTSHGFAGTQETTSHSMSASFIAGEGDDMQRDYEYRGARHFADLPSAASIGELAATRTVQRLHPQTMPSGQLPILFDPRVSSSIVGHLLGAMNGAAIARRSSFLLDRLEDPLFPAQIQIIDNPHIVRGPASKLFDGEGLPTQRRVLVQNGKVTGWLLNSAAARQLNLPPTGHASRGAGGSPGISASNVHMAAGSVSRDAMIADIADGVLVTELVGQGVNGVTGDYSRAAAGFRIRGGEIAEAVGEFTIAGNLLDMFAAITPASDLETYRSINVPTLRIDGMTIAGE